MRSGGVRGVAYTSRWRTIRLLPGSTLVFGLLLSIGGSLSSVSEVWSQTAPATTAPAAQPTPTPTPTAPATATPTTTPATTPPAPAVTPPAVTQPPAPGTPSGSPAPGNPAAPGTPGSPPTPSDPNRPPDGSNGEPPRPEGPPPAVVRPSAPPMPPDRDELHVRLDANGKVRFNFRGQPWIDVVTWLADISQMSLDWQELPGDYLNLTTQRGYSIEEARDLVNRHLLARGYSLLVNDEVLNVVNLKKLDPALVPRVTPEELSKRMPHEFVKVSLPLDSLVAEAAVEELTPMMSPNGKLTALKSTNRLEAMDAVANLRSLYKVLGDEESTEGQERSVHEFELEFAKAADVREQLQKLLGIEDQSSAGRSVQGMNSDQLRQMMQQQFEQMRQQESRSRGSSPPQKQKPDVSIVVNPRRNSILALAPPDKMAVITQAVKMLDVAPEQTQTLMGSVQRMQVYRLAALDPLTVVKLLEESGGLEPTTRVQADEKNKAIVVHGSLADQITIRAVIEKLDGSGRKFHVVPLRRLEADYVAGSVEFMMLGPPEEKQQPSRRSYYYDSDRGSRERQESERDKFRVDADVENNRLLLWANEIEIEEVLNLLEKLGEIPDRRQGRDGATTRVLPLEPGQTPRDVLERLERLWPQLSPNPLLLPELPEQPKTSPSTTDEDEDNVRVPQAGTPARSQPTSPSIQIPGVKRIEGPKERSNSTRPSAAPAPIAPKAAQPKAARSSEPAKAPWQPYVRAAQLGTVRPRDAVGNDDDLGAASNSSEDRDTTQRNGGDESESPEVAGNNADSVRSTRLAAKPAPVRVTVGPDGRLVISSTDTAALDQLEQLLEESAPPRKEFEVFQLKYAKAYWVKLNIEEFFQDGEKESTSSRSRNYYFFDGPPPPKTDPKRRLSKRRPLRFISDPDTNTLLVTGADPSQLQIIADLVELYDQPEPSDSKSARVTVMYQVQWSKAQVVAEAVKDVYRDLLSSNDKALSSPDQRRPQQQTTYIFGEGEGDKKTQVSFKGKLSIGIDEVSNTLILSADGETLLNNVLKMVQELDSAAKPSASVQVLKLDGSVNSAAIRSALEAILDEEGAGQSGSRSPSSSSRSGRDSSSSRRRSR
ncbi:MAG: secretin N-terminal domain-containing protein [Pirellulales bacterium]